MTTHDKIRSWCITDPIPDDIRLALTIATTLLEDADLFLTDGDETTDYADDPVDVWAANNRNFLQLMRRLGIIPDSSLVFPHV